MKYRKIPIVQLAVFAGLIFGGAYFFVGAYYLTIETALNTKTTATTAHPNSAWAYIRESL